MTGTIAAPVKVAHIIYRFDFGGLENGLANLVNRMPAERYRHSIICLAGFGEEFVKRVDREQVQILSIDKRPGKDLPSYGRLWRVLRRISPDIVHTRNIGTIDLQWIALAAGVKHRVHGEHGWTSDDPRGQHKGNLRIRRACRPVIQRYVAMSRDIGEWLSRDVGVPSASIRQLYNGVDVDKFTPFGPVPADNPWGSTDELIIGTVGRLDPVKNQASMLRTLYLILERRPELRGRLRLIIVGDGPERIRLTDLSRELGLSDSLWMPGARTDVAELMRAMDVFALPSLNEGISNTILEAMSSGRPVIAGKVGGNPELLEHGRHGLLYDPESDEELAKAILDYVDGEGIRNQHGQAARARVQEKFSLDAMVGAYADFYDELLSQNGGRARTRMTSASTTRTDRAETAE